MKTKTKKYVYHFSLYFENITIQGNKRTCLAHGIWTTDIKVVDSEGYNRFFNDAWEQHKKLIPNYYTRNEMTVTSFSFLHETD
jgi:hypothetical protein